MGFYYPLWNGGPAKNFSTPPFFDHKSATKLPPEHKMFCLIKVDLESNKKDIESN